MLPYWYRLIDSWVNKRYRSGLTLPFLIGVEKVYLDANLTLDADSIPALIDDILNSNMDQVVHIFRCGDIKEIVLGLDDQGGLGRERLYENAAGEPTIVVANNIYTDARTIDQIVAVLNNDYQDYLLEGEFSKNAGQWGDFNKYDDKFIREALDLK